MTHGHAAGAGPLRARARTARARARHPAAGHLPRHAADERRPRGHARSSTCPTTSATRTTGASRAPSTAPTTTSGSPRARSPRARPGRSTTRRSRTTTRAIAQLGEGLVETGWSTLDELPEAIEDPQRRFALGVQWHPEADPTSRLIAALVEEAAGRRASAPERHREAIGRPIELVEASHGREVVTNRVEVVLRHHRGVRPSNRSRASSLPRYVHTVPRGRRRAAA